MRLLAALLTVCGLGGILVIAYLLCAEKVELSELGAWIVAALLADVAGAILLARGPRPAWATLLLVLAILVPVSVALWFGVLCRLVG